MKIDKKKILEALRNRGQDVRADWVDRELPDEVDTFRHGGLLATLGIDPKEFADRQSS
jgi:hypothetical protein